MNLPPIDHEKIRKLLTYPTGKIRAVIDTDAYNEVDDQFAIAWALRETERMDIEAVYAAPYCTMAFHKLQYGGRPATQEEIAAMAEKFDHFAETPGRGMERSYEEILRLYQLMDMDPAGMVYEGSREFMTGAKQPVDSPAARDLVKRAMEGEGPLYVIALGAITNVASAILMEPAIREKIVVVWLGGQPLHFPQGIEFNLMQDVPSVQVVLDSGVPLVLIPCMTIASQLTVTAEELNGRLNGKSKVGSYLSEIVLDCFREKDIASSAKMHKHGYLKGMDDCPEEISNQFITKNISWSRIIWDISVVGYLMNPDWCPTTLTSAPILDDDMYWHRDESRHPIRICNYISRDHVFGQMFAMLDHD